MIRVERGLEPPSSLAARTTPFKDDVREALKRDFGGKCYLCEGVASLSFDVEHLRPKSDFPELAFTWGNLFPAHSRCNERRKTWTVAEREPTHKRWPKGGMLDCTCDDVESRLVQCMGTDVVGPNITFTAHDPNDTAALNTATELESIHSPRSYWGRQICSDIDRRYKDVNREYSELLRLLEHFNGDWEENLVRAQLTRVKEMLSRNAPYAGLIRTKMREMVTLVPHSLLGL